MDRQHILAEIRRCAAENGGQPLGRMRFARETGIRESDWAGRYWTTWGDAVREAGFSPNEMVTPFGDELLLRCAADLSRKLGRFPVRNDLRMARREDDRFPSAKTFDRFGPKAAFAVRVLEYCEGRPGYDEVASHCRAVLASSRAPGEPVDGVGSGAAGLAAGFVYLVRSGGFHKIGRTSGPPGRRVYEIALQLPERLEFVHAIETDDAVGIERYWHARFAELRANGEWFKLTPADVRSFKRRKFM